MVAQVISFRCILKTKLGQVISSTFNQNVLTSVPPRGDSLAHLAEALGDVRKGEKRRVSLRADQAYGYYDPDLVIVRPLDELSASEALRVGEQVIYERQGKQQSYRVVEVTRDAVTLDGNHPLAGQDLVFEIEALDARAATPEELKELQEEGEKPLLH